MPGPAGGHRVRARNVEPRHAPGVPVPVTGHDGRPATTTPRGCRAGRPPRRRATARAVRKATGSRGLIRSLVPFRTGATVAVGDAIALGVRHAPPSGWVVFGPESGPGAARPTRWWWRREGSARAVRRGLRAVRRRGRPRGATSTRWRSASSRTPPAAPRASSPTNPAPVTSPSTAPRPNRSAPTTTCPTPRASSSSRSPSPTPPSSRPDSPSAARCCMAATTS